MLGVMKDADELELSSVEETLSILSLPEDFSTAKREKREDRKMEGFRAIT